MNVEIFTRSVSFKKLFFKRKQSKYRNIEKYKVKCKEGISQMKEVKNRI